MKEGQQGQRLQKMLEKKQLTDLVVSLIVACDTALLLRFSFSLERFQTIVNRTRLFLDTKCTKKGRIGLAKQLAFQESRNEIVLINLNGRYLYL